MHTIRALWLLSFLTAGHSLEIDGCPLFGCRPSGTFSFYLNITRNPATVAWETNFVMDPVPRALGCVANQVNIVCQSNGLFKQENGYVVLDNTNGTVKWRDSVLHFPTLPIMDNYGDVTGSDGDSLVHYDQLGTLFPVIHLIDMKPVYSMQLVGTTYYLMVSELGGISIRSLNAISDAYIFLNDTIQRTNGTFIPICQPVVNGNRFYLLTEFVPTSKNEHSTTVLNMQRLYALDVHDRMSEVITIAWYYNFERENENNQDVNPWMEGRNDDNSINGQHIDENENKPLKFQPRNPGEYVQQMLRDESGIKQYLLWNNYAKIVYVALPPPSMSTNSGVTKFWALKDDRNETKVVFKSDNDVTHMALFELNDFESTEKHMPALADNHYLWTTLADSKIIGYQTDEHTVYKTIDLVAILKTKVTITSKMSAVRSRDSDSDILIMGIRTGPTTPEVWEILLSFGISDVNQTIYVVAIDTAAEVGTHSILWMVAVPGDMEVIGQISGAGGASSRVKDELVMYVEEHGKSAKILSIH